MNTLEKWYEVMKSNNLEELDDLLADDVVFYSPVVFTPQKGKEITKMYLMAAGGVFGSSQNKDISSGDKDDKSTFRYIKEIMDEEIETVGGLVFFLAGKVPGKEEVFQYNNFLKLKILSASDRSINTIEIDKI